VCAGAAGGDAAGGGHGAGWKTEERQTQAGRQSRQAERSLRARGAQVQRGGTLLAVDMVRAVPLLGELLMRHDAYRCGSNAGQMLVKYWSDTGQIGLIMVESVEALRGAAAAALGQTLRSCWSNTGQILVKRAGLSWAQCWPSGQMLAKWSNAGQVVKCWLSGQMLAKWSNAGQTPGLRVSRARRRCSPRRGANTGQVMVKYGSNRGQIGRCSPRRRQDGSNTGQILAQTGVT
jgi:hypothetical protein